LLSENYGFLSAINLDPIEKKPLYHFHPGAKILSVGSIGCNMNCFYCQNCSISKATIESFEGQNHLNGMNLIEQLAKDDNIGLAFTYNEPTVYYEYMLELSQKVKDLKMKNVMISNGFINEEPLAEILPLMDAFNIDLKAFTDKFYKDATESHLRPVKRTLKQIVEAGKHLEITFLVIPSWNDDERHLKEMVKWIQGELGQNTIFHISRYFPAHKARMPKTSLSLIYRFYQIAQQYLNYVYLGNVTGSESQNTICGNCGRVVISRYSYFVQRNGIDQQGRCAHCGNQIVIT
jgi:pyruvate formate lyase activating enzyme